MELEKNDNKTDVVEEDVILSNKIGILENKLKILEEKVYKLEREKQGSEMKLTCFQCDKIKCKQI